MLLLLLSSLALGGDFNCLLSVWWEKSYDAPGRDLTWTVAERTVYDLWDADARWRLEGGPVLETPDARAWRLEAQACGYPVTYADNR